MRFQQAPYRIADVVALLFIAHGNTSFGSLAPIIPYRSCKHYLGKNSSHSTASAARPAQRRQRPAAQAKHSGSSANSIFHASPSAKRPPVRQTWAAQAAQYSPTAAPHRSTHLFRAMRVPSRSCSCSFVPQSHKTSMRTARPTQPKGCFYFIICLCTGQAERFSIRGRTRGRPL